MLRNLILISIVGLALCDPDCDKEFSDCDDSGSVDLSGKTYTCGDLAKRSDGESLCIQIHEIRDACPCTCKLLDDCDKSPEQQEEEQEEVEEEQQEEQNEEEAEAEEEADVESPPAAEACFSGDTLVETPEGMMKVADLPGKPDVRVKVLGSDGRVGFSPIRIWLHMNAEKVYNFRDFQTASGHVVSASPEHLMYVVPCKGDLTDRFARLAKDVLPGQCTLVEKDGSAVPSKVVAIREVEKTGVYAFTTETSNIIANGVVASVFSVAEYETVQHWGFSVLYHLQSLMSSSMVQAVADGLHPIARAMTDMQKNF